MKRLDSKATTLCSRPMSLCSKLAALLLVATAANAIIPTSLKAADCDNNDVRATLQTDPPSTTLHGKIQKDFTEGKAKGKSANLEEVSKVREEKRKQAESNPNWMEEWEADLTERTKTEKTYPSLEERLAYLLEKSPSFQESNLMALIGKRGKLQDRVGAFFWERHPRLDWTVNFVFSNVAMIATLGLKDNFTRPRFMGLRIKIPKRGPAVKEWNIDHFQKYMTELSSVIFQAVHPEPTIPGVWARAMKDTALKYKGNPLKVYKAIADRAFEYRSKHRSFLETVQNEVVGKLDEVALKDFLDIGFFEKWVEKRFRLSKLKDSEDVTAQKDFDAEVEKSARVITFLSATLFEAALIYVVDYKWMLQPELEKSKELDALDKAIDEHHKEVEKGDEFTKQMKEQADAAIKEIEAHPEKYNIQQLSSLDKEMLEELERSEESIKNMEIAASNLENRIKSAPSQSERERLQTSLGKLQALITSSKAGLEEDAKHREYLKSLGKKK